jgi:hypothetical protein
MIIQLYVWCMIRKYEYHLVPEIIQNFCGTVLLPMPPQDVEIHIHASDRVPCTCTPMSSTSSFRTLLVTHLMVFGAGVFVGHSLNADELYAYRSSNHDSFGSRLRRRLTYGSMGVASITIVILAIRSSRRS